jgi:hypothetical protein
LARSSADEEDQRDRSFVADRKSLGRVDVSADMTRLELGALRASMGGVVLVMDSRCDEEM